MTSKHNLATIKDEDTDTESQYYDALSHVEGSITGSTGKAVEEKAEEEKRESLGSKTSYMLTLIGYAVGFGNLWRFPYRLQTYGGVFLIPYAVAVIFLGLPVLYLELFIGQRLRKGPVGCWNEISSFLGGIGITSGVICLFISFYYNTLIAYCISYWFDSFRGTLPWVDCKVAFSHSRAGSDISECTKASNPSKYYWFRGVLDVSESIETIGHFDWEMYLYLLLAWLLVGVILIKGLEFTGKVVYFTACFPYVVLLIFLIFGWTLHGSINGYKEMFTFDFSKLKDAKIWMDAASQIFFSLGVGCGVLISYSSYLPARNNVWKDSIIVCCINSATSILSCFVVFGITGFKGTEVYEACHTQNALTLAKNPSAKVEECSTISEYINESGEGTGLVFISFAEAIKRMPAAQFFNFIFYMMLLTLGIDSSFGTVEGTIASLLDIFPNIKRWEIAAFVTYLLTLFSIFFAFGWGNHILTLLDYFSVDYPLLSICFLECISVGWIYGLGKFSYDLQLMTGSRPNIYLTVCIKFIAPTIMLTLIIANITIQCIPSYESFAYNPWNAKTSSESEAVLMAPHSIILAFAVVFLCIIWMPIVAISAACKKPLIKKAVPMNFPEEDLRKETGFDAQPRLRHVSGLERLVWGSSVHDFPSKVKATEDDDKVTAEKQKVDTEAAVATG